MTIWKSTLLAFAISVSANTLFAATSHAQNFGGLSIGVSGGGLSGSQGQSGGIFIPPTGPACPKNLILVDGVCQVEAGDGNYRIGGAALGAGAGYDWQFGRFIFGAAADFSWTGARGNGSCGFLFSLPHACGGGIASLGTARAKVGYEIGSIGILLAAYVTGGFAFARIRGWDNLLGGSGATTALGWTLGGGVEALVAPNWSVKLEYLCADLGNRGAFYAIPPNMERLRTRANIFRVGLNYRFNAAAPKPVVAKY